ncbi:hypothetical protein HFRIS_018943 [Herbaspirillum frisingense GSF30]|uniref:Uncharacterized protein n=1 Tax=Herbaspirillum frisingense GSF30 TaxID=864073 RepID=A0AAI9IBW8_9BURK|nr:hypothetical protein [Herbaspirillum frisingense]EOA03154.1 hypothetical protein HFRIS_018943 [Herbaspirillum frisingense GSF30]
METFIGLVLGLLRHLAFNAVFYAIGCGLLKLITLGRYPRLTPLRGEHWRHQVQDVDLVTLLGLLATVALLILMAHWLG